MSLAFGELKQRLIRVEADCYRAQEKNVEWDRYAAHSKITMKSLRDELRDALSAVDFLAQKNKHLQEDNVSLLDQNIDLHKEMTRRQKLWEEKKAGVARTIASLQDECDSLREEESGRPRSGTPQMYTLFGSPEVPKKKEEQGGDLLNTDAEEDRGAGEADADVGYVGDLLNDLTVSVKTTRQ